MGISIAAGAITMFCALTIVTIGYFLVFDGNCD